ncbi:MAG TPA: preprotein translocase subunit SecE [Acidisarcina sp.]|nr:preprotein translocase subunit SecE [Acidisarcina sp.]
MAKEIAVPEGGKQNQLTGLYARTVDFLKDVRGEMRKVVTPAKAEVRATTTVVIVTVFAFAAYFYVVDQVLGRTVQAVLRSLGGAQ